MIDNDKQEIALEIKAPERLSIADKFKGLINILKVTVHTPNI